MTTPMVQTMIVAKITMKAISEKIWYFDPSIVRGNEASTAAAKPRGNITVIKSSWLRNSDLKADIFTATNRVPRKIKVKSMPKKIDVSDDTLKRSPVKTKKKSRTRKLIWQ